MKPDSTDSRGDPTARAAFKSNAARAPLPRFRLVDDPLAGELSPPPDARAETRGSSPVELHRRDDLAAAVTRGLPLGVRRSTVSDAVDAIVRNVLASWQESPRVLERRHDQRLPFPRRILYVPLCARSEQPIAPPRRAAGRDISLQGISFEHRDPLPHTKVAVAFEMPEGLSPYLVTKLTWCRFTSGGAYLSGGPFLREYSAASFDAFDWNEIAAG